jgi:hypothetical protein
MRASARRRIAVSLVAVLATLLSGVLAATPRSEPARAAAPLKWGAFPVARTGETPQQAVQRLETLAGRKLDTVRVFYKWDQPFPTDYENWLKSTGHTLVISVKARRLDGTAVRWPDVASATPGSPIYADIVRWADAVRDFGAPIYVAFSHEPEAAANTDLGVATDYIAAWRKWVSIFRSEGATNAKFIWIMTSYAFSVPSSDRRYAPYWYPGDDVVDAIASDAYNWYTCRTDAPAVKWQSLQQLIAGQRDFWLQHQSKEDWVTEYGTVEDPLMAGRKAQWYADAQALFKTLGYAQFTGVELFEHDKTRPTCAWDPDTSTSSAAAWTAWGQDPYYGGPAVPTDTTVPSAPGQVSATSTTTGAVALSWAAASDPDDATLTYHVYRDGGAAPVGTVSGSGPTLTYTDTGLVAGSSHSYTVTASDSVSTGPPSQQSAPVVVAGSPPVLVEHFDNGLTGWTGSGLTVDPTTGAASPPSVKATAVSTKAYVQRVLPSTYSSLCLSTAVSLASHSGQVSLLKLKTAAIGPVSRLFVDANGVLYARNDVAGLSLPTAAVLKTGWHTVTLCTTIGAAGSISVGLDGVLVGSWTASTGTTPIGVVRVGEDAAATYQAWFDDVVAR